ncbi:MAG: DUF2779 domain-containing protein [Bacillota bacterium]|nr:DUF2779 domain-containing protein [Bacillota bacterium]
MDVPYSQFWMEYYGFENAVSGNTGDSNEQTLALLENNDVILQARFTYNDCRTKIPVLVKLENGFKAIYPHLSAYPKENVALVMKINREIASHCGISIIENEIVYLNKDYIREESLDVHKLLSSSDRLFNKRNNLGKTIEEYMEAIDFDLDENIELTKQVLSSPSPEMPRTKLCTASRRCTYYDVCFDDSQLPDNSILFLTTSRNKIDAYHQGIETISQMDPEKFEGFHLQYAQYRASEQDYFVDSLAIKEWISRIQYPISYLDFEWDTFAIPPYPKMKPFDVLCFQYSLHIEQEDGTLEHRDFFDVQDCREAFILSILENVPENGTVLVYNMEGAEKLRLMQLAEQFPQYASQLKQICDRMVDLSKPFELGKYYHNKMRGHYSLKSVLPVFTEEYSYSDLSVKDGLKAVRAYREFATSSQEEQEIIREDIREYCKMDTFAEYIVYHGLENLIKENKNA